MIQKSTAAIALLVCIDDIDINDNNKSNEKPVGVELEIIFLSLSPIDRSYSYPYILLQVVHLHEPLHYSSFRWATNYSKR